jgi:hypothetical protein
MVHDVFISHARKDEKIAETICESLESARIRCWIAPRDIPTGEDWAKAVRSAIGSSRLMVLVFSENANAATHIEREIANAFYTGRIIMPLRLDSSVPRRSFLSYLDGVGWSDSVNPPAEQNLQEFTARVRDMLPDLPPSHSKFGPSEECKGSASLNSQNPCEDVSRIARYRISRILKCLVVPAFIVAVALPLWRASQERRHSSSLQGADLRSVFHGESAPLVQSKEDAVLRPHYTFTRLGLWVTASPTQTPSAPSQSQETHFPAATAKSVDSIPLRLGSSLDQSAGTQAESQGIAANAGVDTLPDRPAKINHRAARHRARPYYKRVSSFDNSLLGKTKRWLTMLWRKMQ